MAITLTRGRTFEYASLTVLILYIALVTVPSVPGPSGIGLDSSWVVGLNMAQEQGLVHGEDIIWTYGPWSYLELPDPRIGNLAPAVLYRFTLYGIWLGAIIRFALLPSSYRTTLWCLSVLGTTALLDISPERLELPMITLALLTLADRSKWRYVALAVLALLAGTGTMIKISLGVEGIGLLCCCLAIVLLGERPLSREKRYILVACALFLPVTIGVLYAVGPAEITSLPRYFQYALEITSGYSESMSLAGPSWQLALAVVTIVGMLIGFPLISDDPKALAPGLVTAALVVFFAFKQGMVRQDAHAVSFQIKTAFAGLFLFVCATTARDRRALMLFQAFSLFLGVHILVEVLPAFRGHFNNRLALGHARTVVTQLRNWSGTRANLKHHSDAGLLPLSLSEAFHREVKDGTVEAVPWNVMDVRANGWKWQPRPVFQTYAAYTPALDRVNAEHIESDGAADFVLLRWQAIDGRHPFFVDPLSWRALLSRYDVMLNATDVLLMERRSEARFGELQALGWTNVGWGEEIAVPPQVPVVVMEARTARSRVGILKNLLFRLYPVDLEVAYSSGKTMRWRVVRPNLMNGVIANPLPTGLQELVSFLDSGDSELDRVKSFRFDATVPYEFDPTIRIRWHSLPVKKSSGQHTEFSGLPQSSLVPLWLPGDGAPHVNGGHVLTTNPQLATVRSTTIDPQIYFEIGPSLGQYEVIVIRARFETADRIDLFFGGQVDGRGLNGNVPAANRWFDIYINVAINPFWDADHGTSLRFDPFSERGVDRNMDIAGVWGSSTGASSIRSSIAFRPATETELPTQR